MLILRFSLLIASSIVVPAQRLSLLVEKSDGSFTISNNGAPWLSGGEYSVGALSSTTGDLALVAVAEGGGSDEFGPYQVKQLGWASKSSKGKILMYTSFRTYAKDKGLIVFEQTFPSQLNMSALASSSLAANTIFPGFSRPGSETATRDLPCVSYHGVFPRMEACTLRSYRESHQGGAPLIIYDDADSALPMLVFSALNFPKAHHMASSESFFGAGVKATVDIIPAGWSQKFLLSAGIGINTGMMDWGDRMLKFTGKPRVNNMYRDDVHGSIGFWTDNGGYYHYEIGNNKSLGRNYEEVLPKVKAYHDALGVPFKHWQFDSWFYPKDGGVNPGGGGGAVTNWTSRDTVFPHGMAYIQDKLRVPMVMHNRQWSIKSDYIHNLSYEWYISETAAVPKDPVEFFEYFFKQQEGWGLSMYEQDWMCTEYDKVKALQSNISMGDLWLYGMATGAAKSNRTVQYCMPYPYDLLSASSYPAVTNARATGDYFHAIDQWAVGNTALFYWALGILPFKDGFYSSTNKQIGGQTVGPETHPDREALMATLSCAMVGPMDGIYLLNASRVMMSCRKDGKVLKPDKPISVVDSCFRRRDPTCFVYETHSDVTGYQRVHYYFNNEGDAAFVPDDVYLSAKDAAGYVVYNWYTGGVQHMRQSMHISGGYEGHSYAIIVPVVSGWAFIGEVDKYVTASTARFSNISVAVDSLKVSVTGVVDEVVKVCAVESSNLRMKCVPVDFKSGTIQQVEFTTGSQDVAVLI